MRDATGQAADPFELLRLQELRLQPVVLGAVADDDGEEPGVTGPRVRDRRLDGKFLARGPHGAQHAEASHASGGGPLVTEAPHQRGVAGTQRLGHETADVGADDVFGRHAEHALGRGVEEEDALVGPRADDGVHRGAEDAGEPRVHGVVLFVRAKGVGEIDRHRQHTHDAAVLVAPRGRGDLERPHAAVQHDVDAALSRAAALDRAALDGRRVARQTSPG